MKKTLTIILTAVFALAATNCTTSYDAYGNQQQSVDPGVAVAGAAAAGVLGYALAKDNKKHRHYHQPRRVVHRPHRVYRRY